MGKLKEDNLIIQPMVNALHLWFNLKPQGLCYDILVRLAGFNNALYKPNAPGDRQQLSDRMYFKLHLSSPSAAEAGKRMF